jgi:predicted dehydrogenase
LDYRELKIAVAGCGSIGKRHIRILKSLGVRNITAFDTDPEILRIAAEANGGVNTAGTYEELLACRPDAVFILTPTGLHIDMASAALLSGIHVFIEKPLSVDMEGVDTLIALRDRMKLKAMVGFCFRYHEGLLRAKNLLDSGAIGRPVSIRAMVGEHLPSVRADYMQTYYVRYSGAFEMVHDLDLAIWYAGQEIKNSYGVFGAYSDLGFRSPDNVELLIEFEDRLSASVHLDFYQRPRRRVTELVGTRGTILIDFSSWDGYTISIGGEDGRWKTLEGITKRDDMFAAEDLEFLRAVAEDLPVKCTLEEACKSLSVVLNVTRRAGKGAGDLY